MSEQVHERIWLSPPHMGGTEQQYIAEAFASNWITSLGANVNAFEAQLEAFTQTKKAVALSSGTAALHLALVCLGVKRDDVVLCQSFTFAASAFPIQYVGATPVFIDSEAATWNMDPQLLREALKHYREHGKRVGAVIAVHLYGMPAKMNELLSVCAEYEVPLIEDAAEALGSTYQERACGSFGAAGVLSFNGNKIITTSGGGALVGNDVPLIEHARFLSTQAREPFPYYEHQETGFNYRMSNILAGIGRGQMEVVEERIAKRRAIYDHYRQELSCIEGFSFLSEPDGAVSNRWLSTVLIDATKTRKKNYEYLRQELEKHNIETRPLWKPMHLQPVFATAPAFINHISEQLFKSGLCLPSGSALCESELQRVCSLIKNIMHGN
jgi:dTDP-4-amino-4,6-dideoxygalactose transaminase